MGDKKKIGSFILLLALLVVAYFGYRAFYGDNTASETEAATQAGQEILAQLAQLQKIHLDGSLFSSAAYKSLEDFTVNVASQPEGRPNPFAPIGKDDPTLLAGLTRTATSADEMKPEASVATSTSVATTTGSATTSTTNNTAGSQTTVTPTTGNTDQSSQDTGNAGAGDQSSVTPPPPPPTPTL